MLHGITARMSGHRNVSLVEIKINTLTYTVDKIRNKDPELTNLLLQDLEELCWGLGFYRLVSRWTPTDSA